MIFDFSKKLIVLSLVIFSVNFLTACGGSLGSSSLTSSGSSSQSTGSGNVNANIWSGVPTKGSASSSFGLQSFTINTLTNMLYVNFSLPVAILPSGLTYKIPNLDGATLSIQSTGITQTLVFGIPMNHFVRDLNLQGPITLPSGDALPSVPGGSAPKFSAQVFNNGKSLMYVYGTLQYLAVFVPTPGFDPRLSLTFPLENPEKTTVMGYFATIPQQTNFAGGVYMSVVFPQSIARVIDTLYGGTTN